MLCLAFQTGGSLTVTLLQWRADSNGPTIMPELMHVNANLLPAKCTFCNPTERSARRTVLLDEVPRGLFGFHFASGVVLDVDAVDIGPILLAEGLISISVAL